MMQGLIEKVADAMRVRAAERGHPIDDLVIRHVAAAAIEAIHGENQKLRAALLAQAKADEAAEIPNRASYETWQALEDEAKALRDAALAS
jgi:hypothetical protein